MHRIVRPIAAGVIVALGATAAMADESASQTPAATSSLSSVKVARDKETGQLRAPTREENAELEASAKSIAPTIVELSRPTTTTVVRADGSMTGKLSMENMESLVMTRTPDGNVVIRHEDHAEAAAPAAPAELPTE
jgi:hypothetical protein